MYEVSVNTNCACNSIVCIQAWEYANGNKGISLYFFLISVTFTCAVSKLMFNSGKFCDSTADHNQVKEK